MPGRRLVFLNHADDAQEPDPNVDYCVLDSAWSPLPRERPDLIPIRPAVWAAISTRNLHGESLAALDDWADRAGLNRRFEVRGVSWWYHARGFVRLDVHEMLLWRLVLDQIAPHGMYERVDVPQDRPHLLAALEAPLLRPGSGAAAIGPLVTVREPGTAARKYGGGKPSKFKASRRPFHRRVISGVIRRARRVLYGGGRRALLVDKRFAQVAHQRMDVLAIVRAESFHQVRTEDGTERVDPIITPVLRRLGVDGRRAAVVVRGSVDGVRETAEPDAGIAALAYTALSDTLLGIFEGNDLVGDFSLRVGGLESIPLRAGGVDLAPAITRILSGLEGWLVQQQRERLVAERVIDALRPRVVLTGWESARTAWLAAAREHGIPTIAIQHGVIYRDNPDYYRPIRRGMIRPDLTCTFGDYERRLLVQECGYADRAVIATGSPRATLDVDRKRDPYRIAGIRGDLGVARGDRMLVISAARHAVGEELHGTVILANLLCGPLPGVHVVVKLHPEEERGDHYLTLIEGLAAAGGYQAPPVSLVRDIDLYELLRAADAHLGIYSTVLTDAALIGTPNMVAVGHGWADLLGYVDAGVAHPVRSVGDVRSFMANPIPPTPEARNAFVADHYASENGAERVAEAVARHLRKVRAAA